MNALSQPDDIRDSLPARESVMVLEAGDVLYDHSGGSSYEIVDPRSGQAEVTNRFHVVVYEGPEARLYQALQRSQAGKPLRPPARVALKIAINQGFNGPLSAEAQRQSQLSKRAKGEVIAPVIDQGEHQGHVFYTTPWYSQTLDSWLEQAAPDLIQRLGALARLCQATTALHTADAQGLRIVHGDIKPQNIAILAEGPRQILRFLDLGTTRQTSERTAGPLGARAYSMGYSPPGQLIPGAPTLRSDDAFAVAACLFRALSGHRPACASLDYRAVIRRDAPWEQTDKAGDPALFFHLKVFYKLLEGQDLPGLQEQVSEEALKALQGQDDGAQDPALAQHQQALAQQVAERLVTLLRDGLQPEPRKRRQDWLEDAARELEALVALLLAPPQPQEQRPPAPTPAPLPQPARRHGGWALAAALGLGVALTLMVQTPWCQRWAGQEGVAEEAPVGGVAGTLAPEPAAPAPEEPTPEPEPEPEPEPVETEDQAALRQCRESKEGKSCYTLAKKWAGKRDTRELAIEALDVACSAGVGDACQDLGTIYSRGVWSPKKPHKALQYYKSACSLGTSIKRDVNDPCYEAASISSEIGDLTLFRRYLAKGCEEHRDQKSCSELGYYYMLGEDGQPDNAMAFKFLSMSCDIPKATDGRNTDPPSGQHGNWMKNCLDAGQLAENDGLGGPSVAATYYLRACRARENCFPFNDAVCKGTIGWAYYPEVLGNGLSSDFACSKACSLGRKEACE